ncbi:uncharacterized protein [Argopecten irradians]|uniref:uncharacterized protein n=1 Tax=Argopecten irradians TaxID=31199 RepID=UPI0037210562
MGAICSSKASTAVDSHPPSAIDQCDSVVQLYAKHDTTPREQTPTDVKGRVGYISTSEASLQETNSILPDTTDSKMPARLPTANVTVPIETGDEMSTTKPGNPQMDITFTNMKTAKKLFVTEIENKTSETNFDPIRKVLKRDISDVFEEYTTPPDRETIGNFMAEIGLVRTLVELYKYIIDDMYEAFTLDTLNDEGIEKHLLKEIRRILWNFSDQSSKFKDAIAKTRLMFGFLAKDLMEMEKNEFDQIKGRSYPFESAVSIIHNCARSANITKDMYLVEPQPGGGQTVSLLTCLKPFLRSDDTFVKLLTLLALAHMMDDKESKALLETDKAILNFLLEMIRAATKSENRRQQGFSVEELLDGLSRIARNDSNKTKIMEIPDAFGLLKEIIIGSKVETEILAGVKIIWELAFDKTNCGKIKASTDLMKRLRELRRHPGNADLANAASYTYFVINDSDEDTESEDDELGQNIADSSKVSKKKKKKTPPAAPLSTIKPITEQIMLSYNWTHQKMLLKVYDKLTTRGFPVWMDVYHMKGNLLDAMSQAIKESKVVIMCVSEQYGESKNCRTEAQYARKKDKIIIPFMMQRNPNLPGWLDMMIGEDLYYKFYDFGLDDQPAFEKRMEEVIKAISHHIEPGPPSALPAVTAPPVDRKTDQSVTTTAKPTTEQDTTTKQPKEKKPKQGKKNASPLKSWTEDDKDKWLNDNRLTTYAGMNQITCEQLQFLVKISVKAPEFFYRSLKEEVGLKGLEQLMRVSNAIEKLAEAE